MTLDEAKEKAYGARCFIVTRPDCFLLYRKHQPKNICIGRRKDEVLTLRPAQILPEGIRIDRTKGSIPNIVGWSDRLRDAIAMARGKIASATHILCTDTGQPITGPGFSTAWKRAKARAGADWTFHDLKAKGYTDHAADPHRVAGHKTNLRSTYYRRLDVVEPTR